MVPKQSQISWCLLAMVTLCWCCDAEMTRKSLPSARIYPGMSLSSSARVHSNVALLSKLPIQSKIQKKEKTQTNTSMWKQRARVYPASLPLPQFFWPSGVSLISQPRSHKHTNKQSSNLLGTLEAVAARTLTGRLGEWDSFQKMCSPSSLQACFECGRRIRSRRRP